MRLILHKEKKKTYRNHILEKKNQICKNYCQRKKKTQGQIHLIRKMHYLKSKMETIK